MALFGEKYGDQVRVISVGDWARELCGGTHAQRSGQVGMVQLLGEGSIGSGVRRVEALVGADAYQFAAREHVLVSKLTDALKVRPEELPDRVEQLVVQLRDAQRELDKLRAAQVLSAAGDLAQKSADVFGVAVVTHDAGPVAAEDMRALALDVRGRLTGGKARGRRGGGVAKERPIVVVATNDEARKWGVRAGDLVREAAGVLGRRRAVARTTWRRAVAATRPASTRRCAASSTSSGNVSRLVGDDSDTPGVSPEKARNGRTGDAPDVSLWDRDAVMGFTVRSADTSGVA
jgi:alanyl-tRNA synthetase